jgi:hypothetical protein
MRRHGVEAVRRSASTHTAALMLESRGARPGTGRLMGHKAARWAAGRVVREGRQVSAHCQIGIRRSFYFLNLFIICKLI